MTTEQWFALLMVAIFLGTGTGLVTKYVLDKLWIFEYETAHLGEDLHKFTLYTAMGVITTVLFWLTEWSFDRLWQVPAAKYVGAVVGLSAGYFIKYQLDRRFVFVRK